MGVFVAGALVAIVAESAFATDCTQPGNLVPNCGFVVDLAGWYFTASSETHIPDGGASTPGVAELDRHDGVEAIEAFSACFAVSPLTDYEFGASFRLPSGTGVFGCTMDVLQYSDGSCSAYDSESSYSFTPVFEWTEIAGSLTTGAGVPSAQIRMACFSSSDFVIRIDDFLFGQGIVFGPIFADDFESGDISKWSAMSCGNDPAPPAGLCPPECTGGCLSNVCIVDCSLTSSCEMADIVCPPNFTCEVECSGDSSCSMASIYCPANYSCSLSCTSANSCSMTTINCPVSAPCEVLCAGPSNSCSATEQLCGLGNCEAVCTAGQDVITDCGNACSCVGCP